MPHKAAGPASQAALYNAIFNSTRYAIISGTPEGLITTFNHGAERMLGYGSNEVVGKLTPDVWHDRAEIIRRAVELTLELKRDIQPGFECFVARARLGMPDEYEWTFIRKDGSRFPGSLSVTVLRDEAGGISGFLGVIAEITERKQAEESLRLSEERFRNAFEYSAQGFALVGLDGRWIQVNPSVCEIVGYTMEELLRLTFQDITHPDDLNADLSHLTELLAGKSTHYHMEKRYFHKSGSIVWVLLSVSLVRTAGGRPLYFVSQIQNITKQKQSEEALRLSEERLSLATEGAGIGIWDWDVKNNILVWDERMYRLYGLEPGDFSGAFEAWKNSLHPDDYAQATRELELTITKNQAFDTSFRVVHPDGSVHHMRAHAYVQRDDKGHAERLIGTNWDITDQRVAEADVRASLAEKDVLLQEVHHRVKNNLQIVSSLLNLQASKVKDTHLRLVLDDSRQRIRALTLVHERMYRSKDLSALDLGDYLRELGEDLARAYTSSAVRARLYVEVDHVPASIDTAIPCALIVNEAISNAYKYAFPGKAGVQGKITIRLKKLQPDGRLRLEIEDDGVGLPPDIDLTHTLGLQLITSLAKQIDGCLTMESKHGTCIRIEFNPLLALSTSENSS